MMDVFPISIREHDAGAVRRGDGKPCLHDRIWYADWHSPPGRPNHRAQDIFAPLGSYVLAPESGLVLRSTADTGEPTPRGGHWLYIRAESGRVYYLAHMRRAPAVKGGERVDAGQLVGMVGRSGNAQSTCPHLHLGAYVRDGGRKKWVNLFRELRALDPTTGRPTPVEAPRCRCCGQPLQRTKR